MDEDLPVKILLKSQAVCWPIPIILFFLVSCVPKNRSLNMKIVTVTKQMRIITLVTHVKLVLMVDSLSTNLNLKFGRVACRENVTSRGITIISKRLPSMISHLGFP